MFTGIVEELGQVQAIEFDGDGARLTIEASTVLSDVTLGASISVNGCCLTVTNATDTQWSADVVPESLDRTNLHELRTGSSVNLERSMAANGRFGGHVVQGHVDGVAVIMDIVDLADGSRRYTFALPPALAPYVVEKGSVALDGVSLTVASVASASFDVALIPHTLDVTTFGQRSIGDSVNIETDIMGKYVERLVQTGALDAFRSPTDGPTPTTAGEA